MNARQRAINNCEKAGDEITAILDKYNCEITLAWDDAIDIVCIETDDEGQQHFALLTITD